MTNTESFDQERAFVINQLSIEMEYLPVQLEIVRQDGDGKEYRALLKSYTDTAKLYLRLISEDEAEQPADPLTAFNSVYNERGLITI
jgi:hypothetical protein